MENLENLLLSITQLVDKQLEIGIKEFRRNVKKYLISKSITNFNDKELDHCCNALYNRLRTKFDRNISKFGIYTIRNVFNIENLSNLTSASSSESSSTSSSLIIDLNSNKNNLHMFNKEIQNKIIENNFKLNLIQEKKNKLKELKAKYDEVYCRNYYSENLIKNIRDFYFQYNILMQEYQTNLIDNNDEMNSEEKIKEDGNLGQNVNPLYFLMKNINDKKNMLKELNVKAQELFKYYEEISGIEAPKIDWKNQDAMDIDEDSSSIDIKTNFSSKELRSLNQLLVQK